MYHCVPRIISGLSQMFGSSCHFAIANTASGNSRFAGKAARNCAMGWVICAARGFSPIQTPSGTQIALAIAIRTKTRIIVSSARSPTCSISASEVCAMKFRERCQSATLNPALSPMSQSVSPTRLDRVRCGGIDCVRLRRVVQRTAARKPRVAARTSRDRTIIFRAHDCGTLTPGSCSTRKRSIHATSGRKTSWS